jgi:hypothetical protein
VYIESFSCHEQIQAFLKIFLFGKDFVACWNENQKALKLEKDKLKH